MAKPWRQTLWRQGLELGIFLILGTVCPLGHRSVLAQSSPLVVPPPQDINPPRPEAPPTLPVPQPNPETPLESPAPVKPEEARPDLPGNVTVERFEFEGNTAFSAEDLAKVTQPFVNKPITFAELLEAEAAITKHYVDAGYINSGAVIAAGQTFAQQGAVIKIQIIEGGLEEIQITGTKRLRPSYIKSRLKLATAKPLNQRKLLKALQLLQLDPLIETISADLSAGSRPDSGVLNVKIKETKSFRAEIFADNNRNPSVGSFRRGVRIDQGNLSGLGDSLGVEYANTNGSNAVNFNYKIPVNARNGTLGLAGGFSFSNVIDKTFDFLDITGNSYSVELSFRQPILQSPTQEFALGVTASRQESQTRSPVLEELGYLEPLSPGADASGRTRVSALRFFQDWTRRRTKDVFALHSQFNFGLGILDATVNTEAPDSRFFTWRAQGQYVRLLAPDTLLVFRSDLQLSTDSLVSLEQFSLGGQHSVRGYRQDALLTDNGFLASAEVRLPIFRVKRVKGVLHLTPFVDFGTGWNSGGTVNPDANTLAGVGVGLQWSMGDWLTARFDWGLPLINLGTQEKSLQERGLYFSINYSPF